MTSLAYLGVLGGEDGAGGGMNTTLHHNKCKALEINSLGYGKQLTLSKLCFGGEEDGGVGHIHRLLHHHNVYHLEKVALQVGNKKP